MNVRKLIPRLLVIAVIAALTAYLVLERPWAKGDADGLQYQTTTVGKGSIAAQVTANGTLSARTTVTVGAQVSGKIVVMNVDFNSPVKKGDVLCKLDEQVLKSQIDQAVANYDQAVANLKKAEVTEFGDKRIYDRQLKLREQQLIADLTVETAEIQWKTDVASTLSARAQIEQEKAQLDQARLNLTYATIYSPIDGIVQSRAVDVGQTVASSLSSPVLFTIAEDLSFMQIDTSVTEGDVGRLAEKMKATFTVDAYPGKTFEGTVRQVRNSPTTTQGVVTYDAVIDVNNQDHLLRPGMTANVVFVLAEVADAIKIPNTALRFKPSMDAMRAMWAAGGGRQHTGGGHHHGSGAGSGSAEGSDLPPGVTDRSGGGGTGSIGRMMGMGGGGRKTGTDGRPDFGDKKPLWKLVDGKPKMVLIKPGLTDGQATQLLDPDKTDLKPGDILITAVSGVPTQQRKIGAF